MNRSTEGLRDVLFDTLERFQKKEIDASHVKAVTSLTNSILATVAKDLEAARLLDDLKDPHKPKSLGDMRLSLPLGNVASVEAPPPQSPPQAPNADISDAVVVERGADVLEDEPDEFGAEHQTGFGQILSGAIRDHASGIVRHKGSRY